MNFVGGYSGAILGDFNIWHLLLMARENKICLCQILPRSENGGAGVSQGLQTLAYFLSVRVLRIAKNCDHVLGI